MPKAIKQPCPKCGAARCSVECRMLVKLRTNQTCPGCRQRLHVGEWGRIRAGKGRGHFEIYHARCHRALFPSPTAPGATTEQDAASPAASLLSAST